MAELLGIIPARGGSKGIRRKNMRRVDGRPLVGHALDAARASGLRMALVVTTDSDEIAWWAECEGVDVMWRPPTLASDQATVAEACAHVVEEMQWTGPVLILQPTSPLRSGASIRHAYEHFCQTGADSLISVVRDEHLWWSSPTDDLALAMPVYRTRANRQYMAETMWKETGAIQIVNSSVLVDKRSVVGDALTLWESPPVEAIDVDSPADLAMAEYQMGGTDIVVRVVGGGSLGLGHVYRALLLGEHLPRHRVSLLLQDPDDAVLALVSASGLAARRETELRADLSAILRGSRAAMVVFDSLDTSKEEVLTAREFASTVVCFEDLGDGSRFADWVVNDLYSPAGIQPPNVSYGSQWVCLRDEFVGLPEKTYRATPERVLLTFGGTDPGHFTERVAALLSAALPEPVEIEVILGRGSDVQTLPARVRVRRDVGNIARHMWDADLVVTSAGRTVYEVAATGTPIVVLAQNAREATHAHLSAKHGVQYLGLGALVSDDAILSAVSGLLESRELRAELGRRLSRSVDAHGLARVVRRLEQLIVESRMNVD